MSQLGHTSCVMAAESITIRQVPYVPIRLVLSWLPRLKDRISFLIALGQSYEDVLDSEREAATQQMVNIGTSLGWHRYCCDKCGKPKRGHGCTVLERPVYNLEVAKVFAQLWRNTQYCQQCGQECNDHRLMSTRTEKGVCTECLKAEWTDANCTCGIKVVLVDHKPLSKHGNNLTNHCWYAVCKVRYQYIRDVSSAEAHHIDPTLPRSQTGCDYSRPATSIVVPFSPEKALDPLPIKKKRGKKRRRPPNTAPPRRSPRRHPVWAGTLWRKTSLPPAYPSLPGPVCGLMWGPLPVLRTPPLPVPALEPLRERMKQRRPSPRRSARIRAKGENNKRKEGFYYYH